MAWTMNVSKELELQRQVELFSRAFFYNSPFLVVSRPWLTHASENTTGGLIIIPILGQTIYQPIAYWELRGDVIDVKIPVGGNKEGDLVQLLIEAGRTMGWQVNVVRITGREWDLCKRMGRERFM